MCRAPGFSAAATALAAAAGILVAGGCQPAPTAATRPASTQSSLRVAPEKGAGVIPPIPQAVPMGSSAASSAADARPIERQLTQLDAYVLTVPAGSVSANAEFWKRVDEQEVLDPAVYDVLFRNGIRAGVAAVGDWPYFKRIIDEHPAQSQLSSFVAIEAKSLELEMGKDSGTESIWYFDQSNAMSGRTYENYENAWSLSFQPIPREPGHTYLALSPLIRSQRKRLEVKLHRLRPDDPPEREIVYTSPEYQFNLSVRVDLPAGKFLVLAPSTEATGGSLGAAFLKGEGMGQQVERVLLLVPNVKAITGVPRAVSAAGQK